MPTRQLKFKFFTPITKRVADNTRVGGVRTEHVFDLYLQGVAYWHEDGLITYDLDSVSYSAIANTNGWHEVLPFLQWLPDCEPTEIEAINVAIITHCQKQFEQLRKGPQAEE